MHRSVTIFVTAFPMKKSLLLIHLELALTECCRESSQAAWMGVHRRMVTRTTVSHQTTVKPPRPIKLHLMNLVEDMQKYMQRTLALMHAIMDG